MGLNFGGNVAHTHRWAFFLFAALLVGAVRAAPARAQDGWRELAFADDGFAISAAVAPLRDTRKVNTPKGQAEAHSYSFFPPPPGTVFMVTVTQMPAADKRSDEDIVNDAMKTKPEKPEPTTLAGLQGLKVGYVQGEYESYIAVFAKDRRMYQLSITRPTSTPAHPQQDRWLESWHLLQPEAQ